MTIRSGRFTGKIKDVDSGIEIINSGHTVTAEPVYRFFNSGSNSFYVAVEDTSEKFIVEPKDSVDVFVKSLVVIKTESTTAVDVEGIYDCLLASTKVRSGRFNMTVKDDPIKIVGNKGNAGDVIYRVFNSGDKKFHVDTDGQTGVELNLGNSFDIAVKTDVMITAAKNDKLEGIYDLLGGNNPVRPGRFKSTGNHTAELKIIETKKGTQQNKKWYRIYNSGPTGSVIEVAESVGGAKVAEIGPAQTRDLPIGKGAIYVRSTNAATPIEGIYEYLGIVDA